MKENKIFTTDSFQLASFLLSEQCKLLSLDRSNPKRIVFIFEDTAHRLELTQKFLSHQALIEPHKFAAAQKDLKQLIYSQG